MRTLLFVAILLGFVAFVLALSCENNRPVERACMLLIGIALVAFLVWFVMYCPAPSYLPPYGTGTQPMEMRD